MIALGAYKNVLSTTFFVMVVGLSFWAGTRFEAAGYAKERIAVAEEKAKVATIYADHANTNFEALRTKVEASERRSAKFNRERSEALSRAEELEREVSKLANRASGNFTDDELQALTALYGRYFSTDPSGVPSDVPTSTSSKQPATDVRSTNDEVGRELLVSPR